MEVIRAGRAETKTKFGTPLDWWGRRSRTTAASDRMTTKLASALLGANDRRNGNTFRKGIGFDAKRFCLLGGNIVSKMWHTIATEAC